MKSPNWALVSKMAVNLKTIRFFAKVSLFVNAGQNVTIRAVKHQESEI